MTLPEMDVVEARMREVADEVILPRFRSLGKDEVTEKTGPRDLVTVADREAEERLTPILEGLLPGSRVVGEEAVSAGTISTEALCEDGDTWLVDPVDGTWNFVQGSDLFGVMVALVRRREVVQGWILFPVSGECAKAELGGGAFLGEKRLERRGVKPFSEATGDYSSAYVDEPYRTAFTKAMKGVKGTRAGHCSACAYTDLARGDLDFVIQYKMSPWDHAPGQLLVEEAGGRFGFLPDGEGYTPVPRHDRPMLVTGVAENWSTYAAAMRDIA